MCRPCLLDVIPRFPLLHETVSDTFETPWLPQGDQHNVINNYATNATTLMCMDAAELKCNNFYPHPKILLPPEKN